MFSDGDGGVHMEEEREVISKNNNTSKSEGDWVNHW